ncbi:MAG: hypothetical protein JO297_13205 [Nitrososphaeraceae archaeon]|nr:hypothetical protein [Nitrososphaeraceae archaeon]
MVERQIEKQKETEAKEHDLVKVLGITREDTEREHCYYKPSHSLDGDSTTAINGRRRTTTKEGCDDNIINFEIRINNKYASLVPELTREEYEC